MNAVIKRIDQLVDLVLLLAFGLLILVGGYAMYDAALVYEHAQDRSVLRYKPEIPGEAAESLRAISGDAIAWLTLEDTNVDYPVMQGYDNNEYLNKDPYGRFSLSGSIFLDSRCAPDFSDGYSLLYGHHMEYGAMFGALDEYADETYLLAHRHGTLLCPEGEGYTITIFAYLEADTSAMEIFDPTGNYDVLAFVRERASVLFEPTGERLIAFTTCKFPMSTERIIVMGALTDYETDTADN